MTSCEAGRRGAASNLDQETRFRPTRSRARFAASTARARGLTFKDLVSRSAEMQRVIRLGERAAHSNIPVLIEGESGVGKELVARAIQGGSDRKGKPFVTVNCAPCPPISSNQSSSAMRKAPSPARPRNIPANLWRPMAGRFFLDEIGELPLDIQVKLLRALQEGEIDPIGAKRSQRVDIRLISATNRNLIEQVKRGEFREDLFYRLNVFPIGIPSLRSRREDIADLARRFAARFAAEEDATSWHDGGGPVAAHELRLARQCAAAREHGLPRRGALRGRRADRRRVFRRLRRMSKAMTCAFRRRLYLRRPSTRRASARSCASKSATQCAAASRAQWRDAQAQ